MVCFVWFLLVNDSLLKIYQILIQQKTIMDQTVHMEQDTG